MSVKRKSVANFSVGLVAFLLLAITMSGSAFATSITTCSGLLGSNDTYTIDNDIDTGYATTDCLGMNNNTIIDGQGYTVYMNCTAFRSYQPDLHNVTVKNVNIVKYGTCGGTSAGFFGDSVRNFTVENVTITQNISGDDTGFDGMRMCSSLLATPPRNCDNILYDGLTIVVNGTGISIGINATLNNLQLYNLDITTTRPHPTIYSIYGIWLLDNTANGTTIMENITINSTKIGLGTLLHNHITATNVTIESGDDGLSITSDDFVATDEIGRAHV